MIHPSKVFGDRWKRLLLGGLVVVSGAYIYTRQQTASEQDNLAESRRKTVEAEKLKAQNVEKATESERMRRTEKDRKLGPVAMHEYFLTFHPDYPFSRGRPHPTRETKLFIPEGAPVAVGDHFFIVRHSSEIISGELVQIRDPLNEEFWTADKGYQAGIIHWEKPIDFQEERPLMELRALVYRGNIISPDRVGSIDSLSLGAESEDCPIVTGKHCIIEKLRIQLPLSGDICYFKVEVWWDEENLLGDDKFALKSGTLSCPRGEVSEIGLTRILSVSDLDKDSIYELLVRTNNSLSGGYELRYFDGKEFLRSSNGVLLQRTVYSTSD